MSDYAADIVALMEHLNLPRAHVVGASMGGGISVHLALTRPDLVRSLVLAGPVVDGFDAWPEDFGARLRRARKVARADGVEAALADWMTHPFFGATRDRATFTRLVVEFSGASWLQNTWPPAPERSDYIRLGELEKPTLVVVGEHDVGPCLEIATHIGRSVAGARRVVIAGAGHLPCWDRPEEFNRLLLEFLATQGRAPG
jgi:pimeloyl-ACP methyl ester carboxylesterase